MFKSYAVYAVLYLDADKGEHVRRFTSKTAAIDYMTALQRAGYDAEVWVYLLNKPGDIQQ